MYERNTVNDKATGKENFTLLIIYYVNESTVYDGYGIKL